MSQRLEVLLHDQPVGTLSEGPTGVVEFRFLDSYRGSLPRPILGQKFEDDLGRVYRSRHRGRLPDFFANLIPEGRLREVIEKEANLEPGNDLALLAFVGRDLPGAVVVRPAAEELAEAFPASAAEANAIGGTEPAGYKSEEEEEDSEAIREGLRFSLAGVQLKFSMLREAEKLTLPASGHSGEWIVKFDSLMFPHLPENEFSMLEWARRCGFEVPECHLHSVDEVVEFPRRFAPKGTRVLAVARYDRGPRGRLHQEDFAQVAGLPPSEKYRQFTYERMAVLVRGILGNDAVEEFFRRLVFVIATGNNDAHLKNWSLVYPDSIHAQWSPIYDQVATVAWEGPKRSLALKLAGVKDFGRIDRTAIERFGERARLEERRLGELVDQTLHSLKRAWQLIGRDLPMAKAHAAVLREHWRRVPLLKAFGPLK